MLRFAPERIQVPSVTEPGRRSRLRNQQFPCGKLVHILNNRRACGADRIRSVHRDKQHRMTTVSIPGFPCIGHTSGRQRCRVNDAGVAEVRPGGPLTQIRKAEKLDLLIVGDVSPDLKKERSRTKQTRGMLRL